MKILIFFLLTLTTCISLAQKLPLSTNSDSAKYYYYLGWEKVMDDGDYTGSSDAFRKMAEHDDQFLVGLTLLGRISEDIEEQRQIKENVDQRKSELAEDERLLLDVFNELLRLMITRKTDPNHASDQLKKAFLLGEKNLQLISGKYPDDIYYKCEYIEVLKYNHGAKVALDSLYALASPFQQNQPFLLGYAAMLEAELGNYDIAVEKAKQLEVGSINKKVPKSHVVWGDIYLKMGEKEEALTHIEIALIIDPGNIDAQRLQTKLNK